jgi:hypothetical protein
MKLKIKEQYLEWSIGGGRVKNIKLKDIKEKDYPKYYDNGFQSFFEVIEEPKKKKVIEKIEEENDSNKQE